MNHETKFTEAIKQCEANMQRNIENGQILEVELWKKYKERLEYIGIILGILEI